MCKKKRIVDIVLTQVPHLSKQSLELLTYGSQYIHIYN